VSIRLEKQLRAVASSEIQALPTHKVPYPPKVLPDPGGLGADGSQGCSWELLSSPSQRAALSLSVGAAQVLPITAPLNTSLLL